MAKGMHYLFKILQDLVSIYAAFLAGIFLGFIELLLEGRETVRDIYS